MMTLLTLWDARMLPDTLQAYEEKSYQELNALIDKVEGVPKVVFEQLLAIIYKRSK
jgi:hypothetical protein